MSRLSNLKSEGSNRATVLEWLDAINEFDEAIRAEVIKLCEDSVEYRKWIIGYIADWKVNNGKA